jgi:hypothetical protein
MADQQVLDQWRTKTAPADAERVGDVGIRALAPMAHLTHLSLSSSPVGPGLQHLARLSSLGSLVLRDCGQVTDEHLQHLGGLRGLTSLSLIKSSVTGSSLGALRSLQQLSLVDCSSMGPAALEGIAQLTRLTFLSAFSSCEGATPAQLAQLSRLTDLQHLELLSYSIGGEAAALLDLPSLAVLAARGIEVGEQQLAGRGGAISRLVLMNSSAADLRALPQLPQLQSLVISGAPAGVAGLSALTKLTELAVFHISKDVGAADLARALQGLRLLQVLELHGVGCFDEQCLLAVAAMQQLRELWLDGASGDQGALHVSGLIVLHRCTALQRLTLQRCGPVLNIPTLAALVSQRGMRQVVLRGEAGLLAAEQLAEVQRLGSRFGCEFKAGEEVISFECRLVSYLMSRKAGA